MNNETLCKNPAVFYAPDAGICYAINFGKNPIHTVFTGSAYGLALEINIEGT